jgi:hypothetical protein
MKNEQYHDLLGRIQGLTDLFTTLVIALDHVGTLSAGDFAADLRELAIIRKVAPELMETAREQLNLVAELLEDFEASRE